MASFLLERCHQNSGRSSLAYSSSKYLPASQNNVTMCDVYKRYDRKWLFWDFGAASSRVKTGKLLLRISNPQGPCGAQNKAGVCAESSQWPGNVTLKFEGQILWVQYVALRFFWAFLGKNAFITLRLGYTTYWHRRDSRASASGHTYQTKNNDLCSCVP